jgi:hypothetical protein
VTVVEFAEVLVPLAEHIHGGTFDTIGVSNAIF